MVKTLNIPFSKSEMQILVRAKEHSDAESWGKLFIQLATEFVDEIEGNLRMKHG